jgi:hypothetical protein
MDVEDELPPWARRQENDEAAPSRRARPWILVAAVVPWAVVAALVGMMVLRGQAPAGDPAAHSHEEPGHQQPLDDHEDGQRREAAQEPDAVPGGGGAPTNTGAARDANSTEGHASSPPPGAPDASPAEPPTGGMPDPVAAGGELTSGEAPAIAAVALTVARAWLTDVGPRLEIEGVDPLTDRYLEHATVEGIERHGDHAVAVVLAVVLTREGDHYVEARPQRLAVPLRLTGPPRPAGTPWWLGPADLGLVEPERSEPVAEDELVTLAEALGQGGVDEELLAAARTPDGWWIAELVSGREVWLRPGPSGPVASGAGAASAEGIADDHEERG